MELEKLQISLERIEEYQQFIDKANSQKSKFPLAVVQKVILNYELRMEVEKDTASPIIEKIQTRLNTLEAQIQDLLSQAQDADDLQELELMYVIGALTDEDYHRQKQEIEKNMQADGVEELQSEAKSLQKMVQHWNRLTNQIVEASVPASEETVLQTPDVSIVPASPPPPALESPAPAPQETVASDVSTPEEESQETYEAMVPEAAKVEVPPPPPLPFGDPMSAMIEVEEDSFSDFGSLPEPVSDEMVIDDSFASSPHETFIVDDAEPAIGDKFMQDSFADDSFASLGEALPLELEDELAPDLDMSFDSAPIYDEAPVSSEIRSAILLKNEGSPQEEVYTFSGEQYSIGRHQENNIQIKGDTKVSRFHCKLFLRNGHFYIEDQHSSNGTLVNGELISERRLYGGEELKIGETIFRFRLQ